MTTTFVFHEDPGHGWIEVPLPLIFELKIQNKISTYSYKGDNKVYLEEDSDMTTFFNAYKEKHGKFPEYETKYYDRDCFIRNLKRTDFYR